MDMQIRVEPLEAIRNYSVAVGIVFRRICFVHVLAESVRYLLCEYSLESGKIKLAGRTNSWKEDEGDEVVEGTLGLA